MSDKAKSIYFMIKDKSIPQLEWPYWKPDVSPIESLGDTKKTTLSQCRHTGVGHWIYGIRLLLHITALQSYSSQENMTAQISDFKNLS